MPEILPWALAVTATFTAWLALRWPLALVISAWCWLAVWQLGGFSHV